MPAYGRKAIGTVGYLGGLAAVPEVFAWCWGDLRDFNAQYMATPDGYVHAVKATVSFHSAARNSLAQQMRGDWLLQLDTDHEFEPDLAARMLHVMETFDIDVLSAVYVGKAWPHAPILYRWTDDEQLEQLGAWDDTADLIPIGSAGGGSLLVRRKVFERIRTELQQEPFDIIHPFGEDHSFFLRLKRLGIPAYCTPLIETRHLGMRGYGLDDFDREAVTLGPRITAEELK